MKNHGVKIALMAVVLVPLFSACSNKDAEKKITELENKISELEKAQANSPTTITNTPEEKPEEKPEGPLPIFEFAEESHDFGTINEGDVVEHIFKFKNTGEAPLIIQTAAGSCGCTVPEYPTDPIGVGEEGEMKVKFNSQGKPNIQHKTVTITANTWPRQSTLKIKAQVIPKQDPSSEGTK